MKDIFSGAMWRQAAFSIKRLIQISKLKSGDRVVESRLSSLLNMSRSPIREAVRQLQQQGLLEYRPHAGTRIASLSESDTLVIAEMRAFMEVQAIRLIYDANRTDRWDEMEETVARMADLTEDAPWEDITRLDEEFHLNLIKAADSRIIKNVWENVDPYTWVHLMAAARPSAIKTKRFSGLHSSHRHLLDIIKLGHISAAERAIHEHVMVSWTLDHMPSGSDSQERI